MLRITLLGQFRVERDGQSVEIASRPAQSLLAFLVLSAGTRQPRAKLAGLLWPDSAESNALSNLRHTLWRLRKAIGSAYILADNQAIAFDPKADYWLDAAILDKKLSEDASAEELITSVSTYGGELLPGFYDDWVILERTRLQAVFERRMKRLLDQLVEEGRWDDVLRWAEHWIGLGQVPEPAYRGLMVAHSRLGDLANVATVYQRCVEALDEELAVEPSPETKKLYRRLTMVTELGTVPNSDSTPDSVHDMISYRPAFIDPEGEGLLHRQELFVGRERELTQMDEFLDQSLAGRAKVAFVIGEAGRGKTSLLHEFARRAQDSYPDLVVANGVCSAYAGVGDPYLPFREIMGMLTGDVEAHWDAHAVARDHALRLWRLLPHSAAALVEHGPDLIDTLVSGSALVNRAMAYNSSGAIWLNRLQELVARKEALNEGQGPEQNRIFEEFTAVLETLSAKVPLMLILDDLHWADTSSIGLLFHLGRRITESRILFVGSYRPEDIVQAVDSEPHPLNDLTAEFKRRFGDIWVDLDRDNKIEGRGFVDALLDSEPNQLGERFRQALASRTQGHALFTIELLRDMRDRGDLKKDERGRWLAVPDLDWDSLPDRVEGVIERRIGRLNPAQRKTLTLASVEGEEFTAELVAHVQAVDEQVLAWRLSDQLDRQFRLVRAQGIRRIGSQRLSRYQFRHNLFQKYIYNSLDEVERSYLHEAVGNGLETLFGSQVDQVSGILAHHFQAAGIPDKAIDYLLRAGYRAIRLSANEEAIDYLKRGLDLLETLPESPERTQQELALQIALGNALISVKGYGAPEVGLTYTRAFKLSRQAGDISQRFAALWGLWLYHTQLADWQKGRELAEQLLALAERAHDEVLLPVAHRAFGNILWHMGELALAREHNEQGIALYNPRHHHTYVLRYGEDPGVACRSVAASVLWYLGYPDQALMLSEEALTLADELAHPNSQAYALALDANLHWKRREGRSTQERAEIAIAFAAEHGFAVWLEFARFLRARALVELGQVEEGIEGMRHALSTWRDMGGAGLPYFLALLAEGYGAAGRPEKGLDLLAEGLVEVDKSSDPKWKAEIHRLSGDFLLMDGRDEAEAERNFLMAAEVARQQSAKSFELRATMSLCRLLRRQGKEKEARKLLANIYNWFTEGFETPDLIEAKELMDELS